MCLHKHTHTMWISRWPICWKPKHKPQVFCYHIIFIVIDVMAILTSLKDVKVILYLIYFLGEGLFSGHLIYLD